MTKHVGPIKYFWGPRKKFLDVYLNGNDNYGWEWGSDGHNDGPTIALRLFGLNIIYFEKFKTGFHISILGFWGVV